THCRPIGYGAMLLEAFVALIALGTIMIAKGGKAPGLVYGEGLGRFLTVIIGEQHLRFAVTFGAMAFSTFVFDTRDVSGRLGRYILEELLRPRSLPMRIVATTLTVAVPLVFIVGG